MATSHAAKIATTVVTIAQLKFKQAIKNPDNEDHLPPVSVEVSAQLFSSINAVLQQNTPANVQKCTEWIMRHIAPSKARIALLGDYLIAVSKSIVVDQSAPEGVGKAARNRMDLLNIVNDVLHADKHHPRNSMKRGIFRDTCGNFVVQLIERAAECMTEKGTQLEKNLVALVNCWTRNHLASPDCLKLFRERVDNTLRVAQGGAPERKRNYLLPEYHGDKTAPWYDLPASYMLEPMIQLREPRKDSIDPRQIRVQKFDQKPASPYVRNLLDDFFDNIDLKYRPTADNPTGGTTKYKLSLDPLGQIVKQDKETGKTTTVANGYGWSMKFCQDLRKYGVPENIKIAREDIERMEKDAPRHRRSSSIDADYRRGGRRHTSSSRSVSRHRSMSTYDSRRSRSSSRGIGQDRHHPSPNPMRRGSSDYGRQNESWGPDQSRQPPKPHHRDGSQRGSQRGRPGSQNRGSQGSPSNQQYQSPPMSHQNYGQSPFNVAQPGQFQGRPPMPMTPFGAPPPPPEYQGAGAFVPPRPPNHSGSWSPQASNMNVLPNGPQYSSQYGNNYNNNVPYGQNQGGFQGGHGYGSPQRGGYNTNRGGRRGNGRGGRYQG